MIASLPLVLFAAAIVIVAGTFGFIDHARCEFHEVFQRAFNP